MERSRRDRFATHAVPLTWEIPVAVTAAVSFLVLVTALGVQGLMAWLVAGTFAWPNDPVQALSGLLRGRFGVGFAPGVAGQLPSDALMWVMTAVGEVVVLAAALVAGLRMRDLVGGGNTRHGLATSAQAAQALGLPRLRKNAAVIRPDLYARRLRRPRSWTGRKEHEVVKHARGVR